MPSSKQSINYVLDQLKELDDITCKPMMGELLLYYKGVLSDGIYDDRFLVKIVEENDKFNMIKDIPYIGSKPMYLVNDVDDKALLCEIVLATYNGLMEAK